MRLTVEAKRIVAAAAAACMAAAGACAAADAPQRSAHERLTTDRVIELTDELAEHGMIELLEELGRSVPAGEASLKAMATTALVHVAIANAQDDGDRRNALLDGPKAIPLLRKAAELAEKSDAGGDQARLAALRLQLKLAVTLGRDRIKHPHVVRLEYLQDGQPDRKVIARYTGEAVKILDVLKEEIDDALRGVRVDMERYMVAGPVLEGLDREVKYRAAWIRMHRAMAMAEGAERKQLCNDAIAEMRTFRGDGESGVMYWALYVTGQAYRMLQKFEEAGDCLDKAADMRASDGVRLMAWFARVVNRIEAGKYDEAAKAMEDYRKSALALGQAEYLVDVSAVMLDNYLHETQAGKETDRAKAAEHRRQAQLALLGFVEKYADRPNLVRKFLDLIAAKFADVTDVKGASSIVLLARAYGKLSSEKAQDVEEAASLLRAVLRHPDLQSPAIAKCIRPAALWELALVMNRRRDNREAARCFVVLARLHPENRLAQTAAKNAVISLNRAISERVESGQPVAADLRRQFIIALTTLIDLAGAGAPKDVVVWNFELGQQCAGLRETADSDIARLYWQERAIACYERIPPELLEYMESQHWSLEMRAEVVQAAGRLGEMLAGTDGAARQALDRLARELMELERVDLILDEITGVKAGNGAPATQPGATQPASQPAAATADPVEKYAARLSGELREALKKYSDPVALTERLGRYSSEAAAEARKVDEQAKALTDPLERRRKEAEARGLRDWAAAAEYEAAVVKYDVLAKAQPKPEQREAMEKAALKELESLAGNWKGTSVVPRAWEFEIRKRVEMGDTQAAIARVRQFKQQYPEQAEQLIKLVVAEIQRRVGQLRRQAASGDDLRKYQQAYVSFAGDLFAPVKGLPMPLANLDAALQKLDEMEKKGDAAGVAALAGQLEQLAANMAVKAEELKVYKDFKAVTGDWAKAATAADKARLLGDLIAVLQNAYIALRDVLRERYAVTQMYADALCGDGQMHQVRKEDAEATASFQQALDLFSACGQIDDARRKLQSDALDAEYQPIVESMNPADAAKGRIKGMDDVRRAIGDLRRDLLRQGFDPNENGDLPSVEYDYAFVQKARTAAEEQQRLPTARRSLQRAWANHLERLKRRLIVDSANVVGRARALWGLGKYGEALRLFEEYVAGIDANKHRRMYWEGQLERGRCNCDAAAGSVEGLKSLVIRIRQLGIQDRTYGGLAAEFMDLLRRAEERIRQLGGK